METSWYLLVFSLFQKNCFEKIHYKLSFWIESLLCSKLQLFLLKNELEPSQSRNKWNKFVYHSKFILHDSECAEMCTIKSDEKYCMQTKERKNTFTFKESDLWSTDEYISVRKHASSTIKVFFLFISISLS